MNDITFNNIPASDLLGAITDNEYVWKKKAGKIWPPVPPIELIMHVAMHLKLMQTTKYSAIRFYLVLLYCRVSFKFSLLHTYLARSKVESSKQSLVAVTCLFILSKVSKLVVYFPHNSSMKKHEESPLSVHSLLGFCKNNFSRKDVLRCEKGIILLYIPHPRPFLVYPRSPFSFTLRLLT